MKGVVQDILKLVNRYLGNTAISTVWKPGGKIELESIQPNQILNDKL